MQTGIVMPQSEYRAHPAISKSDLFKITKSPLHFKWSMENREDKTAALIFGSACHKYILERDDFDSEFAVALNVDRRTKTGKEEYAKWLEENEGKDVVSSDDMEKIKAMAEVIDSNKFAKRLFSGEHEKSFFWTDEQTEEECKCMCVLKDIFFDDEEEVYQIHPKKSEYVNQQENCLHLWKPIGHELGELVEKRYE